MKRKEFSGADALPGGRAVGGVTPGCMVLEGGAFRGVYTSGVLDALMLAGINLQCTVGVSAGALNGINYVSGQIGRSARLNLKYRHDPRYVGRKVYRTNHGIIGFDFIFGEFEWQNPLDADVFYRPERRFVAVAANCQTGGTEYFEKGECRDLMKAVQASASMPFVSKPVLVEGVPYLDGGCTDKIPFDWALSQDFEKIVVVRTQQAAFRKEIAKGSARLANRVYAREYPAFAQALAQSDQHYNALCDRLEEMEQSGRMFVISPSEPPNVGRMEKNMEKLGALYYLGFHDAQRQLDALRQYLGCPND